MLTVFPAEQKVRSPMEFRLRTTKIYSVRGTAAGQNVNLLVLLDLQHPKADKPDGHAQRRALRCRGKDGRRRDPIIITSSVGELLTVAEMVFVNSDRATAGAACKAILKARLIARRREVPEQMHPEDRKSC